LATPLDYDRATPVQTSTRLTRSAVFGDMLGTSCPGPPMP
jgi:hypothetical protein